MGLGHGADIVRSGLVLHLDVANVKSYPGTGTTWKDLSTNLNNGTLMNGVVYNSANKGSMVFDGVNDYIDCGISTSLTSFASYTISSIIYAPDNINGNYHPIYTRCIDQNVSQSDIEIYGGNGGIQLVHNRSNGGTLSSSVITALPATSLGILDVVYNSSSTSWICYYNGILRNTFTGIAAPLATSTYKTLLGSFFGSYYYFNGSISNIQIYNRALSSVEISQNFEALRGRYGI